MSGRKHSRVLVTSGPTRAWLDRVRYLANASTGRLGATIAEQLISRDIPVLLLAGEGAILPRVSRPELLEIRPVVTVGDLSHEIGKAASEGGIVAVVHAMAVLDYVPENPVAGKRKSDSDSWTVTLVKTPKIIGMLRDLFPDAFLVGFKLESGMDEPSLGASANRLLADNALDLVVANDTSGIAGDCHEAILVGPDRAILARAGTKREIAETLAGFISERMSEP